MRLRPVHQADYAWLYSIECDPTIGVWWRWGGSTPSPEQFAQALWQNVLLQLVVTSMDDSEVVGVVNAHNADFVSGFAHLGLLATPEYREYGVLFDGLALIIDFLFSNWPLRKLYAEVAEYSLSSFGNSLSKFALTEAVYREKIYRMGRYWDQHVLVLDRDHWVDISTDLMPFVLGTSGEHR
ncbi:MAG: GNAT family N-acetyltransferase [Acidimicrobiia bacterium]|nr:GNAT family N-acetyltransferase [Acidimicrobiia bacterium]MDH5237015.1 GNAT family N-acetyltransferase [Acidimicrobiia bacterium]